MAIRNYTNTGQTSALTAAIGATDTTFTLSNYAGDPTPPFTAALARGTATEEVVLVTAVNGSTVTVTRGYDGTQTQAQGAGTTFQEVVVAQDFREANLHVNAATAVHGLAAGSAVVGTTDTQTMSNKTLTLPTLTSPTATGTLSAAAITATGAVSAATLTVTGASALASGTVAAAPVGTTAIVNKAALDAVTATTSGTRVLSAYLGSGTAYPGSPAKSDLFTRTDLGSSLMRWNGSAWRQAERCELANYAAISALPTGSLYFGFEALDASTNTIWRWIGSAWVSVNVPYMGKLWRAAGFGVAGLTGDAVVNLDTARLSSGFTASLGATDTTNYMTLPLDGFYKVEHQSYITGGSATSVTSAFVRRIRSGVGQTAVTRSWEFKSTSADIQASGVNVAPLKAGDQLQLAISYISGNYQYYGSTEVFGVNFSATWLGPLNGATPV